MGRSKGGNDRDKRKLEALLARLFSGRKTTPEAREQTIETARKESVSPSQRKGDVAPSMTSINPLQPRFREYDGTSAWEPIVTRENHEGINQMSKRALWETAKVGSTLLHYNHSPNEKNNPKEQEHGKENEWERDDGR